MSVRKIYKGDLAIVNMERMQKAIEEKTTQIQTIQKDVDMLNEKIAFMEENNLDTFDENEFKVYKTLQLIEDDKNMSRLDKSKAIAKLING